MAVIGSLNINLSVITAPLTKGLKQARGELAGFAKAVTSPVAGLAALAGVGLSGAAFKSFVGGAMESIDVTTKLADRVGIATEALTGLQHAASLAGVDQEQFNASLEKMQKTIGDGAKGGASAEAFARLGLSAEELANSGAQESFYAIADAIKAIENPAERAAAVTDIFGKSGAKLANTLMLGSEGLKAAGIEADKLGISFSRVDAAQVEAANDAMTKVGETFKGVANQIAIQLAPFIEELANHFVGAATAGDGMASLVGKGFEYIAQGAAHFADILGTVPLIFKQAQIAVTQGIQFLTGQLIEFSNLVTEITGIGSALNPEDSFLAGFDAELKRSIGSLQAELDAGLAAPSNGEKITKFFEDVRNRSREAAEQVAIAQGKFGKFDTTFEDLKSQEEAARKAKPRELGTTGAATRGSLEAFATINRSLTRPGEETAKATKETAAQLKKANDWLRQLVNKITPPTVASVT